MHRPTPRTLLSVLWLLLLGLCLGLILGTAPGRELIANPHAFGRDAREWVAMHALAAPFALIGIYIVAAVLALPVVWLQILAGYGFGWMGIVWCQVAATIAATLTLLASRYLLGDWFHKRVEARLKKLREIEQAMGHHGLLVVMVVRLMHFMPFGVSNYAFGLASITVVDVAIGTLLANIPAVSLYVMIGMGLHPHHDWKVLLALVTLNLLLLIPLLIRYTRPQWLRRYGIE